MSRHLRALIAGLICALLCAACVSLPEDGDIRISPDSGRVEPESGFPYDPRPPQDDETPVEIVRHFLDAMLATPTSSAVAKQFLSTQARASWRPDQQLITYEDFEAPSGSESVELKLHNAHRLDTGGRWRGLLPQDQSTINFAMTVEDGNWRIADLPDATIVSEEFFASRFQQVSLYFFDPGAQILVPEPAFVPRRGQLSSALIKGLLRGPGDALSGVAQSYIPEGLTLDLSVPVTADGLASVSLRGEAAGLDADRAERMAVQIAWTLRQDPSVRRIKLTINDNPITLEDTPANFDVSIGSSYDPADPDASPDLFALRGSRLISVADAVESRTDGPFGTRNFGLRSVAVDLAGSRAVGVASKGTLLLEAPVKKTEGQGARTILTGASDLIRPAWDHAERIWVIDRTPTGAVVSVIAGGRHTTLAVPGVSGENVSNFIISRDGTRLAAVITTSTGDEVRLSRLAVGGGKIRATSALRISEESSEPVKIADLAWQSPTRILIAQAITDGITQMTSFPVDGSPAASGARHAEGVVRENIVSLVASPVSSSAVWGVGAEGSVYDLGSEGGSSVPQAGLTSLAYVG